MAHIYVPFLRCGITTVFLKYTIKECKRCNLLLLGMLAKLRKEAIFFVVSALLPDRMAQLSSHCTAFHEIWYLSIFFKYVDRNSYVTKI
jgi:hypothetical protein